jgi:hypothetical protein
VDFLLLENKDAAISQLQLMTSRPCRWIEARCYLSERASISFLQTKPNPPTPKPAMIRIAAEGPSRCDSTPIASTPSGPVPMHTVTIPITRDRVANGASVRIKVVCMFEKAAVPVVGRPLAQRGVRQLDAVESRRAAQPGLDDLA